MVATQTVASRYQVDDELDIDEELCALSAHDVWVDQPIVVTLANPDALGAPRPARRADRVGRRGRRAPQHVGDL